MNNEIPIEQYRVAILAAAKTGNVAEVKHLLELMWGTPPSHPKTKMKFSRSGRSWNCGLYTIRRLSRTSFEVRFAGEILGFGQTFSEARQIAETIPPTCPGKDCIFSPGTSIPASMGGTTTSGTEPPAPPAPTAPPAPPAHATVDGVGINVIKDAVIPTGTTAIRPR